MDTPPDSLSPPASPNLLPHHPSAPTLPTQRPVPAMTRLSSVGITLLPGGDGVTQTLLIGGEDAPSHSVELGGSMERVDFSIPPPLPPDFQCLLQTAPQQPVYRAEDRGAARLAARVALPLQEFHSHAAMNKGRKRGLKLKGVPLQGCPRILAVCTGKVRVSTTTLSKKNQYHMQLSDTGYVLVSNTDTDLYSLANEPSLELGEVANCVFRPVDIFTPDGSVRCIVVLVQICEVEDGCELLVYYGDAFKRADYKASTAAGGRTPEVSEEEVHFFLRHTCSLGEEEIQCVYTSFGAVRHTEPAPLDDKKLDPTWGHARSRKRRQTPAAADDGVIPPLRHVKDVDRPILAAVIKWGSISKERAQGFGALGPVHSVLLQPVVAHVALRQRLFNWVPVDYFPVPGETSEELVHRIGSCPRIYQGRLVRGEDIGSPHKGKSAHSVRVIAYGQRQDKVEEQEKAQRCLLPDYPKVGVPHAMRACEQWPAVIQDLADYVWCLSKPYLGEYSSRTPPNHCEVRFHYVCAGTTVSRHRDFFCCYDLFHYFQHGMYPNDKGNRAQAAQSDVIVFTMSNVPMIYELSFPQSTSRDAVMSRDTYISHPAFQCMVEDGNVTVQRWEDDLLYCHELMFPDTIEHKVHGWRISFAFRSIRRSAQFYAHFPNLRVEDK